jgi:hypothetical protein
MAFRLTLQLPPKDPESDLRKFNIMSMLKYMCSDVKNTQNTLNSIFDGIIYETINDSINIKYHKIFIIEKRPIVYVTSIIINNIEIPINMGFYKSMGISRRDSTIKNYWFPTTQIIQLSNNNYKLSKSEDNYILKYDAIYKLSKNEVDIIEQNNLIQYGRFINKNYALVCYVLYKNNHLLSECEFSPAHFQLYDTNIIYTDFLQGPELIMD